MVHAALGLARRRQRDRHDFIELAQAGHAHALINLPDRDLAYFAEGTQHFDDYVEAVEWAQEFAAANREVMMDA